MWTSIKATLIGLIGSKKVQTALITALSVVFVKYLSADQELANQISSGLFLIGACLIGAQGLTDMGKGDDGHSLTLKEAFLKVVHGLFTSKKFLTAVAGGLAFVLIKVLKLNSDLAGQISNGVLSVVCVLLGAQGLNDMGKANEMADVHLVKLIPLEEGGKPVPANVEVKS